MPLVRRANQPALHYTIDDFTDPWRTPRYIILQHGNGRTGRCWYSWIPYLSRFYRIVRPDVRGLGQSGADFDLQREFTLEHCVDDLLAVIDDLGADSVHVCGESMGGMLGIALAALHPQRVRTLTLVSTPVSIGERGRVDFGQNSGSGKLDRKAWLEASNRGMRFPPDADPGLLDWYNEEFAKNRAEVQAAMANLVNNANVQAYLAGVAAPVLGLYPTDGPITTPEQERMLRDHLRDLRLVHFPTTYHKVQMLFPAACARHLLHFAAQHDGIACAES
jgi:3-oxoadipate enol-lactonase